MEPMDSRSLLGVQSVTDSKACGRNHFP